MDFVVKHFDESLDDAGFPRTIRICGLKLPERGARFKVYAESEGRDIERGPESRRAENVNVALDKLAGPEWPSGMRIM